MICLIASEWGGGKHVKNGKAINLYQHLVRQLDTNSSYCKQFKHFSKYNSRKMSLFETKIKHVDNLSKLFMAPSFFCVDICWKYVP